MSSTSRRRFLGHTALSGAALLSTAESSRPSPMRHGADATAPEADRYDVVVFGGGPAGIVAAAQAARAGAATLLIEKNGILGGTTTVGGVNFPGLFHAWGRQVIAGIGWELVSRCAATAGQTLPDFTVPPEHHSGHQVRVDRALYAALADELVVDAGVDVLFHAMPAVFRDHPDEKTTVICTKTGLREIRSTVVIDCTGDANVLTLAGCDIVDHRQLQPGTLILRLSGYDLGNVDQSALRSACERALADGTLSAIDCPSGPDTPWRILVSRGENSLDVVNVDGRTSEGRTAAELAGRGSLLRLYRFLRAQPGLSELKVDYMATECGIRETVTVRGEATVSVEDYVSGKVWPDAICNSFYPIDWHRSDGHGIDMRSLPEGVVATIPRRALLPLGRRNLLAAGRCIASDQLANSALRVQATCMAVGQAAGAMAALAVASGVTVAEIDMGPLRSLLREHGAIVPE